MSILQLKNVLTTTSDFVQQVYGNDDKEGNNEKLELLNDILSDESQCRNTHNSRNVKPIGDEKYMTLQRVASFPERSFVFEEILTKGSFNAKIYEPLFTIMWLLAVMKDPVNFLQTTNDIQHDFSIFIEQDQSTAYGPKAIINFWRACAQEHIGVLNSQTVHIDSGRMYTRFNQDFQKLCMKFLSMFVVSYNSEQPRTIINVDSNHNLFLKGIHPLQNKQNVMPLLKLFAQATRHTELDALRLIYDVSNMFGFGCLVFSRWFEKPVKINNTARRFFCLRFHDIEQNEFVNDGSTTWWGVATNWAKQQKKTVKDWFAENFGSRELRLVVALPTHSIIEPLVAPSNDGLPLRPIVASTTTSTSTSTSSSSISSASNSSLNSAQNSPNTSDVSQKLNTTQVKLQNANEQIHKMQEKLDQQQTGNQVLLQLNTSLKNSLDNEQANNVDITDALTTLQKTNQDQQVTLKQKNIELQACRDEQRTLSTNVDKCQREKEDLSSQNQQLREEKQACVDEKTKCQTDNTKLEQALQDARTKLKNLDTITQQNKELRNKNAKQHKKINLLVKQIEKIEAQMQVLRNGVSGSSNTHKNNTTLRQQVDSLNAQIATLETQLTKQNDTLKSKEDNVKKFYRIEQNRLSEQFDAQLKQQKSLFHTFTYACSKPRFTDMKQVNDTIKVLANLFKKNLTTTPSQLDLGILTRICCTAIHAKNFSIDAIQLPVATFGQEAQAMIGMDWVMGLRGLALSNEYGALMCNFEYLRQFIEKVNTNGKGFCGTHPGMHMFTELIDTNTAIKNILHSHTKTNRDISPPCTKKTQFWQKLKPKLSDIQYQMIKYEYLPALQNLTKDMIKNEKLFCPFQRSFSMLVYSFICPEQKIPICIVDDIGECIWIYAPKGRDKSILEKIPQQPPTEYTTYSFHVNCTEERVKYFKRTQNTNKPLGYMIIELE